MGNAVATVRYCVRTRQDPEDVVTVDLGPTMRMDRVEDVWPLLVGSSEVAGESSPQKCAGCREVATAPSSSASSSVDNGRDTTSPSSLSAQLPPLPPLSFHLAPLGPSSGRIRYGMDEPNCTPKNYDTLTYGELHQLRLLQGYAKKDSKSVLETRSSPMDALGRRRARETQRGESMLLVDAID